MTHSSSTCVQTEVIDFTSQTLHVSSSLQIHLHHQNKTLFGIKDKGFACAPGSHTLVGVDRFEVRLPV